MAKLAVISTNVGYCSEIIKDNFSGYLFDPINNEQFQEQLQKLVLDKTQRDLFALHLHKWVSENYSIEKGVQLLILKYNML